MLDPMGELSYVRPAARVAQAEAQAAQAEVRAAQEAAARQAVEVELQRLCAALEGQQGDV
ncbi:MAG: hypothetical protein FJZ47_02900 [Candidatus Tectomicrobia bacterium]|uniref:Uncharacterized protein n=1 Tax=Tectimicrobiota bacterium TaxID=2528274 RepID=A0A937VX69_UNCTE|nr:hypothetical protein [Candidatus Tectomicrobia bacterium]